MSHKSTSLFKNLLPFFIVLTIFLSLPAFGFYIFNEIDLDNSGSYSSKPNSHYQNSTYGNNSDVNIQYEKELTAEEQVRKEILELKKEQESNKCEFCNGTGVEKNKSTIAIEHGASKERVCPACDGKGYIKI